jgi:hypothetical protein
VGVERGQLLPGAADPLVGHPSFAS